MTTKPTILQSPVIRELRWIVLAMVITLVVICLLIALTSSNGPLYINLYDTYFVIDGKWLFWVAAVPTLFLVCLVRIIRQRHPTDLPYWIALVCGLIMVTGLTWLSSFVYQVFPKTSLSPAESGSDNVIADGLSLVIRILQFLVLITLCWLAYQWGRRTRVTNQISSPPPPSSSVRIPE